MSFALQQHLDRQTRDKRGRRRDRWTARSRQRIEGWLEAELNAWLGHVRRPTARSWMCALYMNEADFAATCDLLVLLAARDARGQ